MRCVCGQTLRVPNAGNAGNQTQQSPQTAGLGAFQPGAESYWWLMTYIKLNRILGYVFLTLLAIGALLLAVCNANLLKALFDMPVREFLIALFTMILTVAGYLIVGLVYLVIWFASADFLRAVVEIAQNTRRIK